ncbi:mandelate racemase/muconate lactonizing enzyme family protein [Shimia biformata]|uniref:mandelate racemase/muconate lactonizing enzyme family protein n=1 Tax=Shimia biformata TaxID=1294299 RepID=UPI001950700D|nr:mandelate racemase/muconate lactonizing enzyme family protein [Shimia biformata]
MKITAIRTHLLEHKLDTYFESASSGFSTRTHVLVEVETDVGITGWGECLGPARLNAAIVEGMAGHLIGQNPLETEKRWLETYHAFRDQGQRGLTITALSGIDIALWDIKGKAWGVPVSTLMGGRFRESIEAYATGGFRKDGLDRVTDLPAELARYKAEGFGAAKIKIGFDVDEDLEVIKRCRDAIGPDMKLMIDANHGFTVAEAIALGREAAQYGIGWFEEPVLPELLDGYVDVRRGQPIPVAGGETWHGSWGMKGPVEKRCIDILQPDICGTGGFTEAKRISDMCVLHGVRLVPHVWGTGVQLAASLQFLSALPPNPPRPEPLQPMLEFDQTEMPFRQTVLTSPLTHESGLVAVPDGPGLGIEINRDTLENYRP